MSYTYYMEDVQLLQKLDALEKELLEVKKMTRKMYYFFLSTVVATVVAFIVPLIVLYFEIPTFMATYGQIGSLVNSIN